MDFIMIANTQCEDDTSVYGLVEAPIFFNLAYTAPYEDFKELKKLQITERRENIFNKPATLAINLSEWADHYDEEYFIVTMKFLHDMRFKWKYVFVLNSCDRKKAEALFVELRLYMVGKLVMNDKWTERSRVKEYLKSDMSYDDKAAEAFSEILFGLPEKYRNDNFVRLVTSELRKGEQSDMITHLGLEKYISEKDSILNLLGVGEKEKNEYV